MLRFREVMQSFSENVYQCTMLSWRACLRKFTLSFTWNPRRLNLNLRFVYVWGVGNILLYREKINDPLGIELASLETFQAGKKFQSFFIPFVFFHSAQRGGIYEASFLPFRDYEILYDCLWGNIRHRSLDVFGTGSFIANKSLVWQKRNFVRESTIFEAPHAISYNKFY